MKNMRFVFIATLSSLASVAFGAAGTCTQFNASAGTACDTGTTLITSRGGLYVADTTSTAVASKLFCCDIDAPTGKKLKTADGTIEDISRTAAVAGGTADTATADALACAGTKAGAGWGMTRGLVDGCKGVDNITSTDPVGTTCGANAAGSAITDCGTKLTTGHGSGLTDWGVASFSATAGAGTCYTRAVAEGMEVATGGLTTQTACDGATTAGNGCYTGDACQFVQTTSTGCAEKIEIPDLCSIVENDAKTCVACTGTGCTGKVVAQTTTVVSAGTASGNNKAAGPHDPLTAAVQTCTGCLAGFTDDSTKSGAGAAHTTPKECRRCSKAASASGLGSTAWKAPATATTFDNCLSTTCAADYALPAGDLCVACTNFKSSGANTTARATGPPVVEAGFYVIGSGTANGIATHTGNNAAGGVNSAAGTCEVTCNTAAGFIRSVSKLACVRCSQFAASTLAWTGTTVGTTTTWAITESNETGGHGIKTVTATAGDTDTVNTCAVTCSDGFHKNVAGTACVMCVAWDGAGANEGNENKNAPTSHGAASDTGNTDCAWTCKTGYVASNGTGVTAAPQLCTPAPVTTVEYKVETWTTGALSTVAGGATATAAAWGTFVCGQGFYQNDVRVGDWLGENPGGATGQTATNDKAPANALTIVVSTGEDTADKITLSQCAMPTLNAYQFADAQTIRVCGQGRMRSSGGHTATATCSGAANTTCTYTNALISGNANYDAGGVFNNNSSVCAAASTEVFGARNVLPRTYFLKGGTYDDSSTFECDFEQWGFEQGGQTACDETLTGLNVGAACNANTCWSATTDALALGFTASTFVPTFAGKCTQKRSYYLTWASGRCGQKSTSYVRTAGATADVCKTTATAWVLDRANRAIDNNGGGAYTSWKSSTANAARCPAGNVQGGLCSTSELPTKNWDKLYHKVAEWNSDAASTLTVQQCVGAGLGLVGAGGLTGDNANGAGTAWSTTAGTLNVQAVANAAECEAYWTAFETPLHSECTRQGKLWATVTAFEALTAITATQTALYADDKVYAMVDKANWSKVVLALQSQTGTSPNQVRRFKDPKEDSTATVPVVARWVVTDYTTRDVIPAFVALAWHSIESKSVAAVWAALKEQLCTATTTGTGATAVTTYACDAAQTIAIDAVGQKVCEAAGRTWGTGGGSAACDDSSQSPTGGPGTSGTSTSPASVVYSLFALALAAVFAL